MAEQTGEGAAASPGGTFTGAAFFRISTTPIETPIYVWPRAAIPPAPPLKMTIK